jgi:putative exosortase-associated protein (TIGR04073 family)
MKKKLIFGIILCTLILTPYVFAQDTVWDMAESDEYGKKFTGMLGRGLLNVTTCFVDVIVQTVRGTQDGPPFVGTLTGLGGGIACTALRVSSGALDIGTFWVPGFNGIPVSRSYSNCLEFEEEAIEPTPAPAPAPTFAPVAPAPQAAPVAAPAASPEEERRDVYQYVKK